MRRVFVISCLHPASIAVDPTLYKRELRYSQSLLLDCIARSEAPLAGQLDMIRLLCDIDADRHMVDALLAVQAAWLDTSDALVVGCDLGVTPEMQMLIDLVYSLLA